MYKDVGMILSQVKNVYIGKPKYHFVDLVLWAKSKLYHPGPLNQQLTSTQIFIIIITGQTLCTAKFRHNYTKFYEVKIFVRLLFKAIRHILNNL